ncbi:MAG: hypothetical protein V3V49_15420 [Candidatus Krumholzibacteria bacterium]
MKKALLLTVVFTLWATMVLGQAGIISIFADVTGNNCNLVDTNNPNHFYLVHTITPGAMAILFQASLPACYPGIWLSDLQPFAVTVGDSQAGVAVAYGSCLAAPIHVLTVVAFGGGTPACCVYPITPHPDSASGTIEVTDCSFEDHAGVPSYNGIINSNATCVCGDHPVEETTWGRVKSLYGD